MRGLDNHQPRTIKPPTIPHEYSNSTRVGWKTKANLSRLICYICYVPNDHTLPDYKHSITDPDTIVRNYEALNVDSKARVPDKYDLAEKTLLKGDHKHQLAQEFKETTQPKIC